MRQPDLRFTAIGTDWQIDTVEPLSSELETLILARVESFDRTYSRFRPDSLVSTVAEAGGSHQFPDDATALFDLYDLLFEHTDGAVTPLVGESLVQLGYDSEYSLTPRGSALPAADWANSVSRHGNAISVNSPAIIDVGAAGKGYLVDLVGDILRANGIGQFVIDASGDLLVSRQGIRVGLEHPLDPSLAIGVANVADQSICASGSNRRVWGEGLHHILDGRTGKPTKAIIATWVVADTALVADGLATALFFTNPGHLAETFDFQFVRMFASGQADHSTNFDGELFV